MNDQIAKALTRCNSFSLQLEAEWLKRPGLGLAWWVKGEGQRGEISAEDNSPG